MKKNDIEPRSVTVVGERSRTEPDELPAGWKLCRLGKVADWGSGGTPSRKNPEYYNGSIPWIKTGELNESYIFDSEEKISEEAINHSSAKLFPKETVVLAMYGATIGKTAIFGIDASTNQACACAICHKDLDNHYLFNFLKSKKDYFIYNAKGGAQPNISQEIIKNTFIPLPPTLAEQKRIVSRIESLFTKLDEAKDKAQSVVDGFELRRAAILHKAFTGELTAKWRKEHGVKDESWEEKRLEDVCEKIVCGKTPKEFISTTGDIPYLKVYNISNNKIDFETTPQFIPKEIHEGKLASSILKPYDVIMNIVGPPLRKIAIIPEDYPEWNMNQAIVRFRPLNEVNYKYLYWALINPETLSSVIEETRGVVGQQNISVSQSRNLIIPVPTLAEQQEIVRILDTVLEKEADAKETAEYVLEQIALLKKSILARAFRGKL